MPSFRIIDTAGSELGVIDDERTEVAEGDDVALPDGGTALVLEVYEEEAARRGGVAATLVVDVE